MAMPLSRFLAKLAGSKAIVLLLSWINVVVYRATGGRLMARVDGRPVCLVTLRRRRSGTLATIPLMYTPYGADVLLVASLGGSDSHPAWYHNLKHEPQVEIQAGRVRRQMQAREATAEERCTLWPMVVANFPSYENYQRKTARILPIMICSAR
jgi:F420H(2)-dependent quinone reductase